MKPLPSPPLKDEKTVNENTLETIQREIFQVEAINSMLSDTYNAQGYHSGRSAEGASPPGPEHFQGPLSANQ